MNAAGIIFSNLHDRNILELTKIRTTASIPFACRYRFIDFPLSNMVNAGITNINVIAHYNYHSLMDHIGSGKDWDLARRSGGLKILPPNITAYANTNSNEIYTTRLEALLNVHFSISNIPEQYVVLADCDAICNVDINDIINDHIKNETDITIVVHKMDMNGNIAKYKTAIKSDSNNKITDIAVNPINYTGEHDVSVDMFVMSTKLLNNLISNAIAHNFRSFTHDVLMRNINNLNLRVYHYDGYLAYMSSFSEYFKYNMDLINNPANRSALFNIPHRPILTKVRNSPPTYYGDGANPDNSLIADGCTIYGRVENSILFRGVKIGKNAVVKNSILFQDTFIDDNISLDYVVTDKNVTIRNVKNLAGCEKLPYYINKKEDL